MESKIIQMRAGELAENRVHGVKPHVKVLPDTRNHQGFFVSEETYTLIEETEAGWAYICVDDSEDGFHARCHFVNPADIQFLNKKAASI
ncbi:hypothetical protein [Gloeobacter kilaueensis]|uniref:Uncharacterized protein n=1 Tax=Gloeobacter kilaueensis (strain ATCC BAA-2537 / CCAP 1431/1 / ULC 316 / JS1) TaxID=1183438 RepID=U5QI14_GLOK1|nr:hypothetical protein [Gloeobacter kilaueensis]AGY58513.1 hypothetical protein GKIL_2267 [Gloeobacter kilaueensis JS1]